MNLKDKKERVKELKRITLLMNEFEFSQECLIDLFGFNVLNKLEEKEIDVDVVKEDLSDVLVSKLEQEVFYKKLNDLIEELEDIGELKNVKQKEEIEYIFNTFQEFKNDIIDFENALQNQNYREYFKEKTENLVKDLSYIDKKIEDEYLMDKITRETTKKAQDEYLRKINEYLKNKNDR